MQFPQEYFEDEVRDGFYVPGMMKRAWAAQLEILEDIDRVCQKHDITYFAEWGTLLGAVRHGGFVPWDDDMDIGMKREDYNKFLAVAPKELPECYKVINCHNEYNGEIYWDFLTRIVNGDRICFEKEHITKFHGFPYVSGVDIFSMDFLAPNEEEEEYRKNLINIIDVAISCIDSKDISAAELERQLLGVEKACGIELNRKGNLKQQLYLMEERLFSRYSEAESKEITQMPLGLEEVRARMPKEWYDKIIRLSFENMTIPVPAAYDAILRRRYKNYLKPAHSGSSHDYPFYKRQEMILVQEYGIKLPRYHLSEIQ